MNNKIPCGGFYLSDTLGVDENGQLGVNGGEPFKSLVTDGDGNVKWEDRLAYEETVPVASPINITFDGNTEGAVMSSKNNFYKVSDQVFSLDEILQMTVTFNMSGDIFDSVIGDRPNDVIQNNNAFCVTDNGPVFALAENSGPNPLGVPDTYPEPGIYFPVSGTTRALRWLYKTVKKNLDEKFLPDGIESLTFKSSTSGSSKKFKITVNDSGAITATEVTT